MTSETMIEPPQPVPDLDEALYRATLVLRAVWGGISREYKTRYRMDIWAQVQSRAATQSRMTGDLDRCINRLCSAFDGATLAPYDPPMRAALLGLLALPREEQQAILRALRERTATCVLLLRTQLAEEKAERTRDAARITGNGAVAGFWGGTPATDEAEMSEMEEDV